MARIKCSGTSKTYEQMVCCSTEMGESRDCSVVSLAVACGVAYVEAHEAMEFHGRKAGRGASIASILAAVRTLGCDYKRVSIAETIAKYPSGHRDVLKNVTTHHPERFPGVWKDGKRYLIFTTDHVLAVVDGLNHDWTKGRAKRAVSIYEITTKEGSK